MVRSAVLAVAFMALAGCSKVADRPLVSQQIAACDLEAEHVYSNPAQEARFMLIDSYVETCMASRGMARLRVGAQCTTNSNASFEVDCYIPASR